MADILTQSLNLAFNFNYQRPIEDSDVGVPVEFQSAQQFVKRFEAAKQHVANVLIPIVQTEDLDEATTANCLLTLDSSYDWFNEIAAPGVTLKYLHYFVIRNIAEEMSPAGSAKIFVAANTNDCWSRGLSSHRDIIVPPGGIYVQAAGSTPYDLTVGGPPEFYVEVNGGGGDGRARVILGAVVEWSPV